MVADAFGCRLYDRKRFKAGAAVPTTPTRFFAIGLGQSDFVVNATTEQYSKSKVDTNMVAGGQLTAGQFFVCQSIQAVVTVTAATDTTYPTSGAGTELPTNTVAAAAIAASNLTNAILNQAHCTFVCGSKEYESGLLIHFPSRYGISGYAGFGVSTNFEGAVNNGFGAPYELPIEREIPPLVNFGVDVQFVQALTIDRQFTITMVLEGIIYRPVQ
jgi:hypothetical protein